MFPDLSFFQNESHYWVQLATPRFVRHKGAVYNTAFCEAHFFFVRGIPYLVQFFGPFCPGLRLPETPLVCGGAFGHGAACGELRALLLLLFAMFGNLGLF